MVINKKTRKLFESKLFEADNDAPIDIDDSTAEIADDIVDAIETDSVGTATLSDSKAAEIASEVKAVADDTGIDMAAVDLADEILGVENRVTKVLDMALAVAQKNKRRKNKSGCNVLIIGMPGSGKTASIEDWAKFKGLNLVSVNAKTMTLRHTLTVIQQKILLILVKLARHSQIT
jgi:hypothetical protein